MATYSVYRLPGGSLDQTVFVRQGFSWPAFLFSVAWFLWHRLWFATVFTLMLLIMIATVFSGGVAAGLALVSLLAIGCWASDLRRLMLISTGYLELQLVPGRSLEEAELRYFISTIEPELTSPTVMTKPNLVNHEPLGLFGTV